MDTQQHTPDKICIIYLLSVKKQQRRAETSSDIALSVRRSSFRSPIRFGLLNVSLMRSLDHLYTLIERQRKAKSDRSSGYFLDANTLL